MPTFSKDHILSEIRRLAAENDGNAPGVLAFQNATGIGQGSWYGVYWTKWGDALVEAGFKPNKWQQEVPEEEILSTLASYTRDLGRFPLASEMRLKRRDDPTFPNPAIFTRRYKDLPNTAKELLKYAQKIGDSTLEEICKTRIANNRPTRPKQLVSASCNGSVYLMKSDRYYKIGRSNSSGRRKYELSIQLPEKSRLVHEIETDCPPALEKYWHHRFSSKRKNGEWFELSLADVRSFKSRKRFVFSDIFN